jgi:hypothetical protein
MGSPLRIEYPDAFYHITARGNERRNIFRNNGTREHFLDYLGSHGERYNANVFASTILGGRSLMNQIREKHFDRKKSDRDLPDLKKFQILLFRLILRHKK